MTNGTGKPKHLQDFVMTTAKGRDFEFCSGGEEDEYLEVEVHSPTDSSEDSVEVKVSPICLRNKRKCAEPRKVQDAYTAPLKKRMCLQVKNEFASGNEPFRPWNAENSTPPPKPNLSKDLTVPSSITTDIKLTTTPDSHFAIPRPPNFDDKPQIRPCSSASPKSTQPALVPLSLVKKASNSSARSRKIKTDCSSIKAECEIPAAPCDPLTLRVPMHPQISTLNATETEQYLANSAEAFPNLQSHREDDQAQAYGRKEQRNYKNMTRERRIEANARERTRVHTISAAFETLRKAVPAYSHNQKLSKLSVLRIACSYIMTLGKLAGTPVDAECGGSQSLAECVDTVSKTIQKEGKLRKKKDEID